MSGETRTSGETPSPGEVPETGDADGPRSYPGARPPDRGRHVDSAGLRLAVHEWGDEHAPPLLLAHGGMDFARTFDVFAPRLAEAGWRVVAWDQRGHGDSEHPVLYGWSADVRDAVAVMDSVSHDPMPVVGHSKGGGLMFEVAEGLPHRVTHVVNLDGLPSARNVPDVSDRERTRMRKAEMQAWLDFRQTIHDRQRRPGTLDELAERRAQMNTRLSMDWLRYLVTVGASRTADGWRWKLDPALRFGGFGPWSPEWSMRRLPGIAVPVLGVLALEPEAMGWGTRPDDVEPYLPPTGRLEVFDDAGHFVHIEQPERVAALIADFLS